MFSAYRLLRPAQDLQVDSHERHPDALPMPTTRRVRNTSLTDLVNQESGSEVSLEAALGEVCPHTFFRRQNVMTDSRLSLIRSRH
jgi:hypothetical protein